MVLWQYDLFFEPEKQNFFFTNIQDVQNRYKWENQPKKTDG